MVFINEWLPNPVGSDAAGEFVELYNASDGPAATNGLVLKTEKGKKFALPPRTIAPHGYLVFKRPALKLALRNTEGGLSLYDASGRVLDSGSFLGSAPEGKSFSRVNYAESDVAHFAFVDPTPGAANHAPNTTVAAARYPTGIPLNQRPGIGGFLSLLLGAAVLLTGLILYIMEKHEDLSQLFFEGDAGIWGEARPGA